MPQVADGARNAFMSAISTDPRRADAYLALAQWIEDQEGIDAAIRTLETTLGINRDAEKSGALQPEGAGVVKEGEGTDKTVLTAQEWKSVRDMLIKKLGTKGQMALSNLQTRIAIDAFERRLKLEKSSTAYFSLALAQVWDANKCLQPDNFRRFLDGLSEARKNFVSATKKSRVEDNLLIRWYAELNIIEILIAEKSYGKAEMLAEQFLAEKFAPSSLKYIAKYFHLVSKILQPRKDEDWQINVEATRLLLLADTESRSKKRPVSWDFSLLERSVPTFHGIDADSLSRFAEATDIVKTAARTTIDSSRFRCD